MRKLPLMATVLGLALVVGACRNPDYKPDPDVEACNVGGPLGKMERAAATAPNPQAVPGRPVDCRMGPDGVMRLPPRSGG